MYLSLSQETITNNSEILSSFIGEEESESLYCYTDHPRCCNGTGAQIKAGNWYHSNGSQIPTSDSGNNVYVSRGQGTIRLHRKRNTSMSSDLYHCEIPDAVGITQTLFISVTTTIIPVSPPTSSLITIIIAGGTVVALLLLMVTVTLVLLMIGFARYSLLHVCVNHSRLYHRAW